MEIIPCVNLGPRLYDVIIQICYTITQAALPKRNESVLAIQPHQADQPDGMDSLKINHATSGGGGGLWRTLLIWGTVVLTVLILAAVAPICHYSRLRPFNFEAPQMVQRLVGELIECLFFLKADLHVALENNYFWRNWKNVANFQSSSSLLSRD